MKGTAGPSVMLLDGNHDNTLPIAKEISQDLDATIVGVGTGRWSRLFHSKYCDAAEIAPAPDTAEYAATLVDLLHDHRPDIVLPVGYNSVSALNEVRDRIPDGVSHCLPPPDALETAVDKTKTLLLAEEHGIDVPDDFTATVDAMDARGRDPSELERLPFPVFLKSRRETGETLTAKVDGPATFWRDYDDLRRRAGGDVLVQDYVSGDGRTYACGLLFIDGTLKLLFEHTELRSVPREGGSGTRLRVYRDPHLEGRSVQLLDALDWHGVALVEYRYVDDSYVLMEINPKFWASYALASQCGYRFASTLIAETLELPCRHHSLAPAQTGERVFPLRELSYCLRNYDEESIARSVAAMLWPPAAWDLDVRDLRAWLMPPTAATENSALVRHLRDAVAAVPASTTGPDEEVTSDSARH